MNAVNCGGPLIRSLFVAGLIATAPMASAAEVLVSQPFKNGGPSYLSDLGGAVNADSFNLSGSANVSAIAWWGTHVDDQQLGGFSVRLAETLDALLDNSSALGGSVSRGDDAVGEDDELSPDGPRKLHRFQLDLTAPLGSLGGNYYLAIGNETVEWFWATGTEGDLKSFYLDTGNPNLPAAWAEDDTTDMSFEVIGERQTVPEPGILALLGLAGIGGLLARRRRR